MRKTKQFKQQYEQKLLRAVKLLRRGRAQQAVRLLVRLRRARPKDPLVSYNLGLAWEQLKRWREALRCYNSALRLDRGFVDALICKGIIYGNQGRFKDELACYEQALSIDSSHPMAVYNKAVVLDDELDRPHDALRCYQRALRCRLSTAQERDVWLRKCDLLLRLRRFHQADKCLHNLIHRGKKIRYSSDTISFPR